MQTATSEAAQNLIDKDKQKTKPKKSNVTDMKERKEYDEDMRNTVINAFKKVGEIESEISSLQEDKNAIFANLVSKGFNKKGLMQAHKYSKMNENDREQYDNSMVYARSCLDFPMQKDLFVAEMNASFLKHEEDQEEDTKH